MIKTDNIIHKDCEVCGTMFRTTSKQHKYCGNDCRKVAVKKQLSEYMLKRQDIFLRDGYRCVYCGKSSIEDNVKLHLEHIYPINKGGKSDLRNLTTSCEECNLHKKNNVLPYDIIERIWLRNDMLNSIYSNETYNSMVKTFTNNQVKRTGQA